MGRKLRKKFISVIFTTNTMVAESWVMKRGRHVARIAAVHTPTTFYSRDLNIKDPVGDIAIDVRIILKLYLREMECESVDWIRMTEYVEQWRNFVNAV
jgi:hypothetical protein